MNAPTRELAARATTVRLTDLRKRYRVGDDWAEALKGVSLTAAAGEMVALTGPSGSGKSTLLNLAGLIDTQDSGTREIGGVAVDGLDDAALTSLRREQVGFIFQGFNLVPVMNVADNVEYPLLLLGRPPAERRQKVAEMLEHTGLAGLAGRLPDALSGGQRQRVAIARALVKSPSLVIADEPTANLDSHTAQQIVDLLRELSHERGAAVVVATHDERMSAHCDRVLRLADGELVDAHGAPIEPVEAKHAKSELSAPHPPTPAPGRGRPFGSLRSAITGDSATGTSSAKGEQQ